MVCFLGAQSHLCGISHTCDFPPAALRLPRLTRTLIDDSLASDAIDAEVNRRLREGLPLYEIEVGELKSLSPTLILAQSQCSVCAVDARQAASLGVPGAEIFGLAANSLEEMLEECERLAKRLAALGATIDSQSMANLRARCDRPVQPVTHARPKVLVIEWISPLIAAGNWTPDLVERAGGKSLFAGTSEPSPVIGWDDVCRADPDYLFIAPCGFDLRRSMKEAEPLRTQPGWGQLQAVKQGRVFVSNGNGHFHRCGPRLVETIEFLAAAIAGDESKLMRFAGAAERWVTH